jgi:gas vesicle protein
LFFPEKLEYLLTDLIPKFTSTVFNHTLSYIFLFFTIFYLSYHFASGFKNFLIDTIMVNTKNFMVVLMYITVVFLYIIPEGKKCGSNETMQDDTEQDDTMQDDTEQNTAGLPVHSTTGEQLRQAGGAGVQDTMKNVYDQYGPNAIGNNIKNAASSLKNNLQERASSLKNNLQERASNFKDNIKNAANSYKDRVKQKFNSKLQSYGLGGDGENQFNARKAATTVFNIIWNIIRFLIIITITVPLGGFFCLIYFVFYSIYAMLFYNSWDATKVSEKFKQMMIFLDNKKIDLITTPKDVHSLYELFVIKFNEYIEFMSDNFFMLLFLFTFILMMNDSLKHIVNNAMRNTVFYIDFSFIFMVFMSLLIVIKSKFNINNVDDAVKWFMNKSPEKNYDSARDIFFVVNLLIYILSLGGLGYFFMLFINFNITK